MVRLKGSWRALWWWFFRVSIPYGSIKSHKEWRYGLLFPVSIPYGSIKRGMGKEYVEKNKVSIPYGSIKSPATRRCICRGTQFQFLMVRLKVTRLNGAFAAYSPFQFLMVRLKARKAEPKDDGLVSFNSLWFD